MKAIEFICPSYSGATYKKQLEEMRPRLYKVAYSWCHAADIADDLVQDTVVKAIRNANSLRDIKKMNSWLFTILANCWRDYLRQQKPTEDIDECIFTNDDTPELAQERQNITDIVQQAVATLPQGQRQVLSLVDLEGFSYAEVAEIIGIPTGTVMSRLNRARKALSELLLELKEQNVLTQSTQIRIVK
ncbi:MAG: RNA polymerase sigma factor [Gammaproteobacteria bacterium]|nr:RNA polymerase sigma factor [Gammaproteobacteria bacterium]